MKLIGILTKNFSVYYDLIKLLKQKNIKFESLCFDRKIPAHIGVVITTKDELKIIKFNPKIAVGKDLEKAVQKASLLLTKRQQYNELVIGVDPGETTGCAVVADSNLIQTFQCASPESASEKIIDILIKNHFSASHKLVRIGHGARTYRDRIIKILLDSGIPVEIVNESTIATGDRVKCKCKSKVKIKTHIQSATDIAFSAVSRAVKLPLAIHPTPGELKHIQRKSRLVTGSLTISKELAELVAEGIIDLDEAIKRQMKKKTQI